MPKHSSNRGVMIVLAYLWPLALVPYLVEKEDPEVQWHARQGLALLLAELAAFMVSWIAIALITLVAFGLGILLSLLLVFAWIGVLVVHLIAIVKGLNGARLVLPGIGSLADRLERR